MSVRLLSLMACLWVATPALAQVPAPQPSTEEPSGAEVPEPPQEDQEQEQPLEAEPEQEVQPPEAPEPPAPPVTPELPEAPASEDQPLAPPPGEITLEDWNRDDWLLVKPSTSMIELNGYFRLRPNLFRKLNFGNGAGIELAPGTTELVPRYTSPTDNPNNDEVADANFNWTDIRVRLQPQINITDQIQIFSTIDLLDNLVLGSTPNTVPPPAGEPPVNIVADTQTPAERGYNTVVNAIVVKRLWARLTALNEQVELRFGRMPNHWGLGMYANDGDCLDCDFGFVADRVALTFRAADHLFTPMFDWIGNGPVFQPFTQTSLGQPVDALDSDDAVQYSLRISRVEHPEDIAEKVREGGAAFTYGLWNLFRTQDKGETAGYYVDWEPGKPLQYADVEERNGFIYTVDGYATLWYGGFKLAIELAFTYGNFDENFLDLDSPQETTLTQLGGALEGSWQMPGQRPGSVVTLMAGGASGDSAPGFGAFNGVNTQRGVFRGRRDLEVNNFQFSPDYHVDLLLFRRIIGLVTDAWYVRPGVTYMFDDKFAGKVAAVYSQALFGRSTPGGSKPLGLEIDGEISYGLENLVEESPFGASLAGGVLFPFSAFENLNADPDSDDRDPSFAWTVQGRVYIVF